MKRQVTYGLVYLRHSRTGFYLASESVKYDHQGSSQQQVVGGRPKSGANCVWRIKAKHGQDEHEIGQAGLTNGDVVRLEHVETRKNLHSHDDCLPSNMQDGAHREVTCYFSIRLGEGDEKDNWRVEIEEGGQLFYDHRFRLINDVTHKPLHLHDCLVKLSGKEQHDFREVTCYNSKDENDFWVAEPLQRNPGLADFLKDNLWMQLLNFVGSIASVTGVSFLVLRDKVHAQTCYTVFGRLLESLLIVTFAGVLVAASQLVLSRSKLLSEKVAAYCGTTLMFLLFLFFAYVLVARVPEDYLLQLVNYFLPK